MRIHYNVTGRERKALVNVVAEITGEQPVYRFMPTCAYDIGCFTVTKDGTLEFSEHSDSETVEAALQALIEAGFEGVGDTIVEPTAPTEAPTAADSAEPGNCPDEAHTEPDNADSEAEGLTMTLPSQESNRSKILLSKLGLSQNDFKESFWGSPFTMQRNNAKKTGRGKKRQTQTDRRVLSDPKSYAIEGSLKVRQGNPLESQAPFPSDHF